ncbi:hypothetical protein AVEN_10286-1 [Araneus ventricosus]|uniref:Uncharacterized protein n=1 Tax=Araneus ventricosus TaxID=182803 RepID=A0A4Y2SJ90_ARAVE|nr:hypothetical protein AVEN_10286-1 [Araneus ventricosus]
MRVARGYSRLSRTHQILWPGVRGTDCETFPGSGGLSQAPVKEKKLKRNLKERLKAKIKRKIFAVSAGALVSIKPFFNSNRSCPGLGPPLVSFCIPRSNGQCIVNI